MKIDLEFNIETLRISDLPEDEQESNGATSRGASSIIDSIKRKTNMEQSGEAREPSDGAAIGKVRANVESTKLRDILNNMSNDED